MKNFKILVWALIFTTAGADVYAAGEVAATRQVTGVPREVPGVTTRSIPMTRQEIARRQAQDALDQSKQPLGSPRSITESSPVQGEGVSFGENEANNRSKDLNRNDGEGGEFELKQVAADQNSVDAQVEQKVDNIVNSVSQAELTAAKNDPAKKSALASRIVDQISKLFGLSPKETADVKAEATAEIQTVKVDEPGAFSKWVSKMYTRISNGYLTQSGVDKGLLYHVKKGSSQGMQTAIDLGADVNAIHKNGVNWDGVIANAGKYVEVNGFEGSGWSSERITRPREVLASKVLAAYDTPRSTLYEGDTALNIAVSKGDANAINTLVTAGADVKATGKNGNTALHIAAKNGDANSINVLIESGADVNAKDNDGNTALHYAAKNGDANVIKALITAGADVNAKDNDGNTILHYAAGNGNANVIKALITAGADVNAKDNDGNTALHYAAKNGDANVIKALITAGADVNATGKNGETALHIAAINGNADAIKALKDAGVDVNATGKNGNTILHYAARNGDANAIKALKDAGADVNAKDNDGNTALHYAAKNGDANVIKALITAGADVNAKDNDGNTALHKAASNDRGSSYYRKKTTDVINALITAGANVNATGKNGETALHIAASNGNADAIKALAKSPVININAKDPFGNTALHNAAYHNDHSLNQSLKYLGSDPTIKNNYGLTPLNIAQQSGNQYAALALSPY